MTRPLRAGEVTLFEGLETGVSVVKMRRSVCDWRRDVRAAKASDSPSSMSLSRTQCARVVRCAQDDPMPVSFQQHVTDPYETETVG